jgi:hypothetical protein
MPVPIHLQGRNPCPFLPDAHTAVSPSMIREQKHHGGEQAYLAHMTCAQSLWLQGLPAQVLLQLNHAMAVDLDPLAPILQTWPLPYRAKTWIFQNHVSEEFMGNPVRHYQHLATRVSGPRRELRSWRAWACFHLAQQILPAEFYPCDDRQMTKEHLTLPSWQDVLLAIESLGIHGEAHLLQSHRSA